jgi:hypothetical protein
VRHSRDALATSGGAPESQQGKRQTADPGNSKPNVATIIVVGSSSLMRTTTHFWFFGRQSLAARKSPLFGRFLAYSELHSFTETLQSGHSAGISAKVSIGPLVRQSAGQTCALGPAQ